MVSLRFYNPDDFSELNYSLDAEQSMFTSSVENALKRIKERNDGRAFPVTVYLNEKRVGFFVLDFGNDKCELSRNEHCVLLRSLSINPEFQGKGVGKETMSRIDAFVRKNFCDCSEIVLAVNHNNSSAFQLYLRKGYLYEGKSVEGRNGPQYVMTKALS